MDEKYFHKFLKSGHVGDLVRILYDKGMREETGYISQLNPERVFLQSENPLLTGNFCEDHPIEYSAIHNYVFLRLQQRRLEGLEDKIIGMGAIE